MMTLQDLTIGHVVALSSLVCLFGVCALPLSIQVYKRYRRRSLTFHVADWKSSSGGVIFYVVSSKEVLKECNSLQEDLFEISSYEMFNRLNRVIHSLDNCCMKIENLNIQNWYASV